MKIYCVSQYGYLGLNRLIGTGSLRSSFNASNDPRKKRYFNEIHIRFSIQNQGIQTTQLFFFISKQENVLKRGTLSIHQVYDRPKKARKDKKKKRESRAYI